MKRLTDKNHNAINKCSEYSSCYSCHKENCYIKEIEEKLGELEDVLEKYGIDNLDDFIKEYSSRNIKLANDNYDLEQELAELKQKAIVPKKIVNDFYDEIRHRAILEDDYCPDHNFERKYGLRKCVLEDIRTTILKKYGGENE